MTLGTGGKLTTGSSADTYWAAQPKDELGAELMSRVEQTYNHVNATGLFTLRRKAYYAYFGMDETGGYHKSSAVAFGGEQGELTLFKVNHFRNIVKNIVNYATQNRPALDARAANSDFESLAQATLANSILDYYMKVGGVEQCTVDACELGVALSEGYVSVTWDTELGDPYGVDPQTGKVINSGDVRVESFTPVDIIKDPFRAWDRKDWAICRRFVNRFDLIANYPELEQQLLGTERRNPNMDISPVVGTEQMRSDDCAVFEFYHRRTPAVPQGRHVIFAGADCIMFDGPLPYDDIPIYRIVPDTLFGTSYGYTDAFDLLSIQQAMDSLHSAVLSNQSAFAVQNIVVEDGTDVGLEEIRSGLNLIKIPKGAAAPQALQMTATPTEVFKYIESLQESMQLISGVNSTARGAPDANLKSGTALAFMESRTMQFMGGLQRSYVKLLESVGTAIIKLLKTFATTPRIVEIVGKDNKYMTDTFSADNLRSVQRVIVDVGNPLTRVMSGRLQIADTLLERGLIKQVEQYFEVLQTGRIQALFEGDQNQVLNIKRENQLLSMGPPSVPSGTMDPMTGQPVMEVDGVPALVTDNHPLHIFEHAAVLSNPDARSNPDVVRAAGDHIAQHFKQWEAAPAALLQSCKIPPFPAPMPMGLPPPGEPPIAPGGGGQQAKKPEAPEPVPGQETAANMPQMPKNPMTGERVPTPGGQA